MNGALGWRNGLVGFYFLLKALQVGLSTGKKTKDDLTGQKFRRGFINKKK